MLTPGELTDMRRLQRELMPDRCTITRVTLTPDGSLGQTAAEMAIASNLSCRLVELGESRGQRDAELGGRIGSRGESVVRLPFDTPILEEDRIDVETANGTHTLAVQRVIRRPYATALTVVVSEVR